MGVEALIASLVALTGMIGSFYGGRKSGKATEISIANDAVSLLQSSIEELRTQNATKDLLIADLHGRVRLLEDMVTQRAEVEAVHADVKEVHVVVNRIAAKVGA